MSWAPPPQLLLWLSLSSVACSSPRTGAVATREAHKIWSERCVNCHGQNGDGDGPQARLLDPSPRRLRDLSWQSAVTDDQIRQVIVEGGQAVGKSPLMAPNPDLADKPEVVDALLARIRNLR